MRAFNCLRYFISLHTPHTLTNRALTTRTGYLNLKWRSFDEWLPQLLTIENKMSHKVRTGVFIAGFTALTLAALYPIVVYPKLHPEVYSKSIYLHLFTSVCSINSLRHSIFHPHPPNGKHNSDSPFRVPIQISLPHLSAPIQIPTPQCVTEILNNIPNP